VRRPDRSEDLVTALVELRDAIGPLVDDVQSGLPPSIEALERWTAFLDAIARVIPLCRQHAVPGIEEKPS
jgi:hypothetical protein